MRRDDGRAIPTFISQALDGADLTVHGTGEQTRSFIYVSDLVDSFVALLDSDAQTPVNVGNPDERAIRDVARLIIEITDSDSTITFEERPDQDPEVRCPDISKATAELGWQPSVSFEEGLRWTIEYFNSDTGSE